MKKLTLSLSLIVLLSACSTAPAKPGMDDHAMSSEGSSMSADQFKERLTSSPRHQEWVDIKNGEKTIHTFVVYPQTSTPAPVVLLIHENRGLNDWARSMADEVAELGYIAVAPDLLSGYSAEYESTSDFPDDDARVKAISSLKPESVTSDLLSVVAWTKTIPSATKKIASAGFCWGGGQSFSLATNSTDLAAALVFYGPGPKDESAYAKITAPVFGFYGGADDRINATIPDSEAAMKKEGKTYDVVTYDDAGHAFMRLGEDPAGLQPNIDARNQAWERMKQILSTL